MKRTITLALLVSFFLHALLAAALALYLSYAPEPDELAQLDLTSVELSFSETVEETAAAVASAPSAPSEPAKAAPPPPPTSPVDAAFPPRPVEAAFPPPQMEPKLPSPTEQAQLFAPVIVRQESEVERRETRDEKPHETQDEKPKPTETARTPPPQASPPQQTSAPRQARVDAPPKPRRAIKPDYPRESRLRGEHGDVSLELDVAADGTVTAVRILKSPGYPLLDEAAVKAARAARFTPAKSGGKPVASTVRLTLNFRLK